MSRPPTRASFGWSVMWAGGVVLVSVLLILSSVMIFAPAEHERDHELAGAEAEQHESR